MPYKVFTFVPAFGQMVSATTFMATHALQARLGQAGIVGGITTLSFPDIAELRSMAVTVWYDTMPDTSHILFIDSDMGINPDMVMEMLAFGEPVVGTIYRQRRETPIGWAGSGTSAPQTERRGNFMEVEGVGMGCTIIHRDAITRILQVMPQIVDTRIEMHPAKDMIRNTGANRLIRAFEKLDIPDRGIVSEDLSFCLRWRECGGKVWANIGHRISHVGPFDYSGRYLDVIEAGMAQEQMQAQAQAQALNPNDVRAADPVFTPLNMEAIPSPGTVQEMPGGPMHRREGAVLPGDIIQPSPVFIVTDPEFKPGNGADHHPAPKRGRGRPKKTEQVQGVAA